jgi:hypothetical protein
MTTTSMSQVTGCLGVDANCSWCHQKALRNKMLELLPWAAALLKAPDSWRGQILYAQLNYNEVAVWAVRSEIV